MSDSCGIDFLGNPQKLCFSGQTVSANAIVFTDKQTHVKGKLVIGFKLKDKCFFRRTIDQSKRFGGGSLE